MPIFWGYNATERNEERERNAMRHTKEDLKLMQSLPLETKIRMTKERIKAWYENWCKYEIYNTKTGKIRSVTRQRIEAYDLEKAMELPDEECVTAVYEGQVYVSFSGGKDSTVLLHIARQMYPDIEAVFVNTGLEYPEIQKFVKSFDNVTILRPKMRFDEVIKNYGYPMIGKKQADVVSLARKNIKDGKYTIRLRNLGIMPDQAKCDGLSLPDAEMLERYENTCNGSKYSYTKYQPLLYTDFEISNYCCDVMKKKPAFEYQKQTGKQPIIATMTGERCRNYLSKEKINRQKAEIERLNAQLRDQDRHIKKLKDDLNLATEDIEMKMKEIERLRAKTEKRTQEKLELGRIYTKKLKICEVEAIRAFADMYVSSIVVLFNLNYAQTKAAMELRKRIEKGLAGDV